MKKLLLATLCGALALAMAAPAMADHSLGGYYRVQFISAKADVAKDGRTYNFVDQRLRAKWTNTLNDYVSVVWYGEVDTPWGQSSKGGVGGGGKFGSDGVNVETKHVYATVKVPDTSFVVKAGVQGFGDIFGSTYIDNDAAGLNIGGKFGMASVNALWVKFDEGANSTKTTMPDGLTQEAQDEWKASASSTPNRTETGEKDMYGVAVALAPSDAVKVGLAAYYEDENTGSGSDSENTLLTIGATAAFAAGPVMMDIGVAAQDASYVAVADNKDTVKDDSKPARDGSALMAYVKGAMAFGDVKTFARVTYFSADDDKTDENTWVNRSGFEFYTDGLMIFGTDVRYNNGPGGRHAYTDAAYAGYGLLGLTLGADMKIADYGLHLGMFYGMSLDDKKNDEATASKEGTQLGTEINCQLSRNVGEKANVALRGAYALLGDFYDAKAGGNDPDDLYTVQLVLNIGY